jgi:5-methylcytosine-specific restriction endonuclease McrA
MLELKRIYWSRQVLRLAYSAVIVWLSVSVVLAFTPKTNGGASAGGSSIADIFRGMFDAVLAAVIAPGTCAVILAIAAAIIAGRDVRRRDPVRRFTRQQRRDGMARADGQCEMEVGFRRRCSRPAEHGDHFYAWSKGGSTSLQNLIAACARCNRAKGARIPSPAQQERLERRRREYVTLDHAVAVGERQPLP